MAEIKERKQREFDERYAEQQRLSDERDLQLQRETQQRLREIHDRYAQQSSLIQQHVVVLRRRRTGVADAA